MDYIDPALGFGIALILWASLGVLMLRGLKS